MLRRSSAPTDHLIQRRDWKFGRDRAAHRWWHGGDPGRTAFYNALSSICPAGERFVVLAVHRYRAGTPPAFRSQIDDLVFQESMHLREHVLFNRQATDAGYDLSSCEERAIRTIARASRRDPLVQLAATCALEHLTAILANAMLSNPTHLDGADEEARRLWRWHAMEEIEHKGVAFDTWNFITRAMPNRKRWLMRTLAMVRAAMRFHYLVFRNTADLLAQDGRNDWRTWLALWHYLYWSPGLMRALVWQTPRYLRPGFHPWQHDDRELAARALVELAPSFQSLQPK